MPDTTDIGVSEGQAAQLASIASLSIAAGKSITTAFASGVAQGKKFEDVLKSVALKLADMGVKAAMGPLSQGVSSLFSGFAGSLSGGMGGGGFDWSSMMASAAPSAKGNVVSSPTYFPLGGGLGVMGEAGSEAVMPLARGPDGSLGVRSGGGVGRPMSVTVNVATPDAESFRRSEAQISAALARAVSRGQRAL